MDKSILDKINKFTRREFTEDEIYVFSVVLCDNDIDRDNERFSDKALETMRESFIGKTGIFDHDPSSSNQTARIFDAEVAEDADRLTKNGQVYKYLKASAYMIRTEENRSLIAEIDGGIKKEVSISCSAAKRTCSVCGSSRSSGPCTHIKGRMYDGKLCHTVLDDITDTYEWSFVAVPAQVRAGVTKRCSSYPEASAPVDGDVIAAEEELRRDVRKLAYFVGGRAAAEAAAIFAKDMDMTRLIALKKTYEKQTGRAKTTVQLLGDGSADAEDNSGFSFLQEGL